MYLTKHSDSRMRQRGIRDEFVKYAAYFFDAVYEKKGCYKIFLSKKIAVKEAKMLRKLADIIEKHAGAELIVDSTVSRLVTTYRR